MKTLVRGPPVCRGLSTERGLGMERLLLNASRGEVSRILRVMSLAGAKGGGTKRFSLKVGRELNVTVTLLKRPRLLVLSRPAGKLSPVNVRRLQRLVQFFPRRKVAMVLSDRVLSRMRLLTSGIKVVSNKVLKCRKTLGRKSGLRSLFVGIMEGGRGTNRVRNWCCGDEASGDRGGRTGGICLKVSSSCVYRNVCVCS